MRDESRAHLQIMAASSRTNARETFLTRFQNVIDYCVRLSDTDGLVTETKEDILRRMHDLRRDLNRGTRHLLEEEEIKQLESAIEDIKNKILCHLSNNTQDNASLNAFQAERIANGKGAPRVQIEKDQLHFLAKYGFTSKTMAEVLGTSESTVKRRLRTNSMKLRDGKFSSITDEELCEEVRKAIGTNQQIGPNAIIQRLKQQGITIQRERVRQACRTVDPVGCAARSLGRRNIQRRTYRVFGPNSLWHIDGNHKLISISLEACDLLSLYLGPTLLLIAKWEVVIHGSIDGFSRMVTFLQASNNNLASTVQAAFMKAIALFGTPSRIRVDNGIENVETCRLMEELRGRNRGSAIRGKSCHNQRIERLWVDVWESVTNEYYDLFTYLEQKEILDIARTDHMQIFHYVFLPRLNASLKMFRYQHNNHGLSTENYKSPNELFIFGVLSNYNSDNCAIQELINGNNGEMQSTEIEPATQNDEDEASSGNDNRSSTSQNTGLLLSQNDAARTSSRSNDESPVSLIEIVKNTINPEERILDVSFGVTLFRRAIELVAENQ